MNKENKLAQLNGQSENLRKQKIIKGVRTKYPNLEDEVAILRKTIANILTKLNAIGIECDEFKEYNFNVEDIKIKITNESEK